MELFIYFTLLFTRVKFIPWLLPLSFWNILSFHSLGLPFSLPLSLPWFRSLSTLSKVSFYTVRKEEGNMNQKQLWYVPIFPCLQCALQVNLSWSKKINTCIQHPVGQPCLVSRLEMINLTILKCEVCKCEEWTAFLPAGSKIH